MLLHEEEACHSYRQSSSWHLLQVGNIIRHASPKQQNITLVNIYNFKDDKTLYTTVSRPSWLKKLTR